MSDPEDAFVREQYDANQFGVWVRDRVPAIVASYNDLRARLGTPTFDARRAAVRGDGDVTTAWTLREQATGHVLRLQDATLRTAQRSKIEPDDFEVAWRIASVEEPVAERLYRWLRAELEPIKMTARLAILNPVLNPGEKP